MHARLLRRVPLMLLAAALTIALVLPAAAEARPPKPTKPDYKGYVDDDAPATATVGSEVRLRVHTRRIKPFRSMSPKLRLWLSADKKVTRGDKALFTKAMTPSGFYGTSEARVKFMWPETAVGVRYLIACADYDKKIPETNEANNCNWFKMTGKPKPLPKPKIKFSGARPGVEGATGAGGLLEYDVSISNAYDKDVKFTVTGETYSTTNPASTSDFVRAAVPGVIPAGQTSTTVRLQITGDELAEVDEVVIGSLGYIENADYVGFTDLSIANTITDDDEVTVSAAKATTTTVKLTLNGAPTNLAADGSQFTIAGHTVTRATAAKEVVTLTVTPVWVAATLYTVNVSGLMVGNHVVPTGATFTA